MMGTYIKWILLIIISIIFLQIFFDDSSSKLLDRRYLRENFINDKKYYYCSDKKGPGTYYRVVNKEIKKPIRGFYSDLISIIDDKYWEKTTKYFKTPICKEIKNYDKDYFNDNKIIDIEYNDFISETDPFYQYDKPENIEMASTYNEEINKNILEESDKLIKINLLRVTSKSINQ